MTDIFAQQSCLPILSVIKITPLLTRYLAVTMTTIVLRDVIYAQAVHYPRRADAVLSASRLPHSTLRAADNLTTTIQSRRLESRKISGDWSAAGLRMVSRKSRNDKIDGY